MYEHPIPVDLWKEVFEKTKHLHSWIDRRHFFTLKNQPMLTDISKINRNTEEGKLLFASIIELTTRLHTHSTPEEVIKRLWDVHNKTEEANKEPRQDMKCCVAKSELAEAIDQSKLEAEMKKSSKLGQIMRAGNTLLEHSVVLGRDAHEQLKDTIVAIYRIAER